MSRGGTEFPNQRTVERYMDGFRRTDREQILSCLTDDVRWWLPGAFDVRGKDEFAQHIVDEGDVVVAEGSVKAPRTDGSVLDLVFCDVFEMRDGKIRSLTSYLMNAN